MLRRSTTWLMNRYERRLPHWDAVGVRTFVTFRLHGSLPVNRAFPPERLSGGKAFVAMDRLLDHAREGPMYLRQTEIATLVMNAILDGDRRFARYQLHAFVIMPFRQQESYDHLVRNDDEFGRITRYIESNPLSAGLADAPEAVLWSSAAPVRIPAAKQKL